MHTINIKSTVLEVRRASTLLHQFCEQQKIAIEAQGHLELILVEALNNVVEHAYQGQPDGNILIEIDTVDNNTVIKITDQGIAAPGAIMIEGSQLPDHNKLPEGGWGLCLIQALADTIEYFRFSDRNTLVLTKGAA